jgi:hypothetical protein
MHGFEERTGLLRHGRTRRHLTHASNSRNHSDLHPAHALGLIRAVLAQLQDSVPAARGAEGSETASSVCKNVPSAAAAHLEAGTSLNGGVTWGNTDSWAPAAPPGDPALHTLHACSVHAACESFRFVTYLQSQLMKKRTGAHRPP